ncbi:transcription intermediary factor 1-beta-like [Ruditapes philippinarum]|uniref:transcription intermediary factor 1-beta-like n=1 Tax=Ruditapes philippinarum TaxID=129788 RepID=UPI00295AA23D|nr:transcription intermediary factor 1-beta-like [Ruditapes philippinarum]
MKFRKCFCEHCDKHDKQYVPAEGFCEDCVEYLCGICLKFHKRYMPTHTTKDNDNMPQDFCLEKCSVHQDELVKFYCQACKKFACTECKTQDHGNCSMISHLPTLVPGIENSQEIKELYENLNELMKDLENTEEQVNINKKEIASQETKILDKVMKKKKEILSAFEKHQKEIIQDFEKKIEETLKGLKQEKKEKIEKLQEHQRKLEKLLNDEENEIKKKIEIIKRNDKKVLKTITEETSKMKTKLNTISQKLVSSSRSGTVFVCGYSPHNIHQLSSDLTKVKILLGKEQGIIGPSGVAYCQNTNRLYVCQYANNIKVYDLSLE